jgi:nicotinate phosphoribosyltransferase
MKDPFAVPGGSGLATDLYQLTMAAAYRARGLNPRATFELFVRRLPRNRSFLLAAGLEQALRYLEELRFEPDEIEWLRGLPVFRDVDLAFLSDFRFTGDVDAIPEGTAVFENEPLLRVSAPLIEAQIAETYLLSTVNFQTLIASKAARGVLAARGRPIFEFGFRRAHGPGAAMLGARAAMIAGCAGTSNVLAGRALGVPVLGTMAHSWVMAHDDEARAFEDFARTFPGQAVLLVDTYDTLEGVRKAARIPGVTAVRLDSGDLGALARESRRILDEAGARDIKIVASGDLNEYKIHSLLAGGAPIDAFGVGTELATSVDAPALGGVYKLVEMEAGGRKVGRAKASAEKATYPLGKQVFRTFSEGRYRADTIGAMDEPLPGEKLLVPAMRNGRALGRPALAEIRELAGRELARLPGEVARLDDPARYPVRFSDVLERARRDVCPT